MMSWPNSTTSLNMVIGHPVTQSLSPELHTWFYKRLDINAILLAFSSSSLPPLIKSITNLGVGLTAVTLPFKEKIISYLDQVSPEVTAIGAANTILQKEGKLIGTNTDVAGIAFALKKVALAQKKILIIGAGGAARAAGYFFAQQFRDQPQELCWLNRSPAKAATLANQFGGSVFQNNSMAAVEKFQPDLIINATSLGLLDQESPLPKYQILPHQTVFDMVYSNGKKRHKTALIEQAEEVGATAISGETMLLGQAIRQIELWQEKSISTSLIGEAAFFIKSLLQKR